MADVTRCDVMRLSLPIERSDRVAVELFKSDSSSSIKLKFDLGDFFQKATSGWDVAKEETHDFSVIDLTTSTSYQLQIDRRFLFYGSPSTEWELFDMHGFPYDIPKFQQRELDGEESIARGLFDEEGKLRDVATLLTLAAELGKTRHFCQAMRIISIEKDLRSATIQLFGPRITFRPMKVHLETFFTRATEGWEEGATEDKHRFFIQDELTGEEIEITIHRHPKQTKFAFYTEWDIASGWFGRGGNPLDLEKILENAEKQSRAGLSICSLFEKESRIRTAYELVIKAGVLFRVGMEEASIASSSSRSRQGSFSRRLSRRRKVKAGRKAQSMRL